MSDLEGGLDGHRVEFVPETTNAQGEHETPANPAWERPADTIYSVGPTVAPGLSPDRGLGDIDIDTHRKGPEDGHEVTVEYPLQQWLVDGSGNAHDLAGYGAIRDSDGNLPSTLTFVDREDKGSIAAVSTVEAQENGVGGASAKTSRDYWVGKGGKIGSVDITVDPSSDQPAVVEVPITFEKLRKVQVDQPGSGTELTVRSTDAGDTSQTLTIEDEGAGTVEDVALNGTTVESTSSTFADIDALSLDAETTGRVIVSVNDGTSTSPTEGEHLAVIEGAASYDGIEGDLGIPALGTGSHAAAIGNDYLRSLTDSITFQGTSDYWFRINSKSLSIDNNLDSDVRDDSLRMDIQEGTRSTEMSVTTYGQSQTYADARTALTNDGGDLVWTFPGANVGNGTITLKTAKLTGPGVGQPEAEQPRMTNDETFAPEGGGTSALQIA